MASDLAPASSPQMNMVGGPPGKLGLTMNGLPMQLNALTKWAWGAAACRRSIRLWPKSVKNDRTPFSAGASAMGLVASSTVFPVRLSRPASSRADSAPLPLTANTMRSAKDAASAKVPTEALAPAPFFHSASLAGERLARITS